MAFRPSPLSPSEVYRIIAMRNDGESIELIAKVLYRHRDTVTDCIKRAMSPEHHPHVQSKHPPEFVATVLEAWSTGQTASQIGAMHGMTRSTILGIMHRAKAPKRADPFKHNRDRRKPKKAPRPYIPGHAPQPPVTRRVMAEAIKPEPYLVLPDEPPIVYSVETLEDHHCRWPVGEVGSPGFGFCGKLRYHGHSFPYCANHIMRSIRIPPPNPGQTAANDSQPRHRIVEAAE